MTVSGAIKPRVLIIGGGIGGLTTLHQLQHSLKKEVAITLVDANGDSVNRPMMPDIALAGKPAAHSLFPLDKAVNVHGAEFCRGTVESIDASLHQVRLGDGRSLIYDYLVIAPGAVHAYDAVDGLEEFGYSVCDETHASQLWDALQGFKGGDVVIGSAPTQHGTRVEAPILTAACEGPVGEVMFMMDYVMRKRGVRDQSTIKIFSPAEVFFEDVGPKVHEAFGPLIEKSGIEVVTNKDIVQVADGHVSFSDGTEWPSDLSIVLPPHAAPAFIENSGLGDEAGWVPTDSSMRHLDESEIFAVGDCNALAQPKLGHLAVMQGEIAAKAIAKELGASVKVPDYRPEVFCIMNRGGHEATLILTDTLYGGSRDIAISGALPHAMKWGFDLYVGYTHGHLPPHWSQDVIERLVELKGS